MGCLFSGADVLPASAQDRLRLFLVRNSNCWNCISIVESRIQCFIVMALLWCTSTSLHVNVLMVFVLCWTVLVDGSSALCSLEQKWLIIKEMLVRLFGKLYHITVGTPWPRISSPLGCRNAFHYPAYCNLNSIWSTAFFYCSGVPMAFQLTLYRCCVALWCPLCRNISSMTSNL